MSTFLITYATSQSSSYPIVFMRLVGPSSRPNPHLKLWKCRESDTLTPWSVIVIEFIVPIISGHGARMEEGRSAFKILTGKPTGKRPLGRARRRLEDNIRMDLEEIGINAGN